MLKKSIIAIILLSVILLITQNACAIKPPKASITGTVYMDGRSIAGTVILRDANGGIVVQQKTSIEGHYRLVDLAAGTYTLGFLTLQGVEWPRQETIQVRLGRPEIVDLQLLSSDIQGAVK